MCGEWYRRVCVCVCVSRETGMYLEAEMCVSESVGDRDVEGEKVGCGERSNLDFYVQRDWYMCLCVCRDWGMR